MGFGAAFGGALAGSLGGLLTRSSDKRESQRNRNFEADQAEINRKFQERMSNTAMQRMKVDMEKAGINPLLGISGGGASTPSGGQGSGAMAPSSDPMEKGISSAIAAKQLELAMEKQEEEIDVMKAQKKNINADTTLKGKGSIRADVETQFQKLILNPLINSAAESLKDAKQDWNRKYPGRNRFKQPSVPINKPSK